VRGRGEQSAAGLASSLFTPSRSQRSEPMRLFVEAGKEFSVRKLKGV
jgi:hypothetical protein